MIDNKMIFYYVYNKYYLKVKFSIKIYKILFVKMDFFNVFELLSYLYIYIKIDCM